MGKECKFQFFNLYSPFEPNPTLEPKLDLSHILKSVLIHVPFILELQSSILLNHSSLLDQDIDHNDSEMIFQDWLYNGDDFYARILPDPNKK